MKQLNKKYKCYYMSGGGTEYDGGIWEKKETKKTITFILIKKPFRDFRRRVMKKLKRYIIKFIIWIFEKFAFDDWVELQENEHRSEIKRKYNLKDNEIDEALIDIQREPYRQAYNAGREDGFLNAEKYFKEYKL